jgi:hypothetical protein
VFEFGDWRDDLPNDGKFRAIEIEKLKALGLPYAGFYRLHLMALADTYGIVYSRIHQGTVLPINDPKNWYRVPGLNKTDLYNE